MKKPTLVIMAAGMGSRYGGMKQVETMDPQGHIIMDFSIYDAVKAGFGKVVLVIKKENEEQVRRAVGDRISRSIPVAYAYQELGDLPEGFSVPEGRVKPWGTGHAVLSARHEVDGPFAVINADDYYGAEAFDLIAKYLCGLQDDGRENEYAMVGYVLRNTLTENGTVARGCCEVDEGGFLTGITERTKIRKSGEGAEYSEDDGLTWTAISPDSTVSMNMWGFSGSFMKTLEALFPEYLEEHLRDNPLKCEYFLPYAVDRKLSEGSAKVKVLTTKERWYGVTYREDKEDVVAAIARMKAEGKYPENF